MSKAINPLYYDVVRRPILTEKATIAGENGKFFFEVDIASDKPLIKKAIEAIFGVSVVAVNVTVTKGKKKIFKGRSGVRKDYKKAMVTLASGQTIDFTTGV